jgi:uncharacterized protein
MSLKIDIIWSDLSYLLTEDSQGNLKKVENVQAVLTSIDNILRTYKTERVMLPEFASSLRTVVFESMNSPMLDFLSREIKNTIEKWEDRVIVTQVKLLMAPDDNAISLEVQFGIKGYSQIFKYETSIKGEVDE